MRTSFRPLALAAISALVLAACGGSDDVSEVFEAVDEAADDVASDDVASDDVASDDVASDDTASDEQDTASDDGDESTGDVAASFGTFVSGDITFSGAEEGAYPVDDPVYTFTGAGGCFGGSFGMTVDAREADTGYTAFQLAAEVDADLAGGGTGTFDVEDITLLAVTDGDLTASRSYEGPGTISITEHDTGGAGGELYERRMVVTLDGALAARGSEAEGSVDVSVDVVWVMGCP